MKKLYALIIFVVLSLTAAQAQLSIGETKEFQDATFTLTANLCDSTGKAVYPLPVEKIRRVPTVKGWTYDTIFTVKSARTIDSKGNPKYEVFYQYGVKDPMHSAKLEPIDIDSSITERQDAHLISVARWHLTMPAENLPIGDDELIIYVRQITVGRSRNNVIIPLRGSDIKDDRPSSLAFTGVEYNGPADVMAVTTFMALRNQEEAQTGIFRTQWTEDVDGPALEQAVKARFGANHPQIPPPTQVPSPPPTIPTVPTPQPTNQPPDVPKSYGQVDRHDQSVIIDPYDRDIVVELDDPSILPVSETLQKGRKHRFSFKGIPSRDELVIVIRDAATKEILEKIPYAPEVQK